MSKHQQMDQRLVSIDEFEKLMFENEIGINDVGIEGTIIAYWRRHSLLPFFEKGTWAKLTVMQVLWLRMLHSLRSLGCGLEVLKQLTDYFIKRAYKNDLPKRNLTDHKDVWEKKKLAGTITKTEEAMLKNVKEVLKDTNLLDAFKWDINYFTNLVSFCLQTGMEAAILVFEDGTIAELREGKLHSTSKVQVNRNMPHIFLPIKHYLEAFIDDKALSAIVSLTSILNEDETRVIREMNDRNVQEIIITMRDGITKKIETSRGGVIQGDKMEQVKKMLQLRDYESITLNTRDDKTISFKRTKKKINSD